MNNILLVSPLWKDLEWTYRTHHYSMAFGYLLWWPFWMRREKVWTAILQQNYRQKIFTSTILSHSSNQIKIRTAIATCFRWPYQNLNFSLWTILHFFVYFQLIRSDYRYLVNLHRVIQLCSVYCGYRKTFSVNETFFSIFDFPFVLRFFLCGISVYIFCVWVAHSVKIIIV